MYKIISISNRPHVVVYQSGHLTCNFFQSYDYSKCVKYINDRSNLLDQDDQRDEWQLNHESNGYV